LTISLLAMALILLMVGSEVRVPWLVGTRPVVASGAPTVAPGGAESRSATGGVDAAGVMEVVSHRVAADATGTLVVEDDRYRAAFDTDGFEVGLTGDGPTVDDAALRVTTTDIARGATALGTAAGPWRGDANVAERSLGAGIVERVTATDGQVEWDVILDAEPTGRGDLRIEAELGGSTEAPRAGADGLRFDLGDGQSMLMGPLVVKDRTGAELYRAIPDADRAGLALVVPDRVLHGAAYPVTVDPTVSPESPVAGVAPGAPAYEVQDTYSAASDGTNHLVVWRDFRKGGTADIYGARVSGSGTVLDPIGIPIASVDGVHEIDPAVAFDGTNFMVTWSDYGPPGNGDIRGARVNRSGTVLDPGGFAITTGPSSDTAATLAFDGTNYLVVWMSLTGNGTNTVIRGSRVSPTGTVLDGAGFQIATGAPAELPDVAFDGTNYLVVWTVGEPSPGILAARVSRAGVVLDQRVVTATGGSYPSVAFGGTTYLVTWTGGDTSADVYAARVGRDGTVLDPNPIAVSALAGSNQRSEDVVFDGTNFFVAWGDDRRSDDGDIYGARVSPAGAVLDPAGLPLYVSTGDEGTAHLPALSFDGTNVLVLWQDGDFNFRHVSGTLTSPSGAVVTPAGFRISTAANAQMAPVVAFDGTNHLVVWEDNRSGNNAIYGARVNPAGTILDGAGFAISAPSRISAKDPAVVFDGTNFFVVWADVLDQQQTISGARVSPAGVVLDPANIVISTGEDRQTPAVAFNGTNYLVGWYQQVGFRYLDTFAARVSAAGTVLGDPIQIDPPGADAGPPAIASDGTNFLVVISGSSVSGYRVSPAGVVIGDPTIIGNAPERIEFGASAAFDGANYLVVWSSHPYDGSEVGSGDIYGARLSPDGTVIDAVDIPISTGPGQQNSPAVVFNGSFLVVWRDERAGAGSSDIYGARVDTAGNVRDANGFAVAAGPDPETVPALAAGPGDRTSVVYQRYAPEAPYGAPRSFLRTVAPK
jgi:hypothetical protein